MANLTADYGFVPKYSLLGELREIECAVLVGASNMFVGDPVKMGGTGDSTGRPSILIADAGDALVFGVIVGFRARGPDDLAKQYSDGADTAIVVPTLPGTIFRINPNGSTGVALNDIGLLFDHIAGAGDTLTGRSGYTLGVGEGGGTGPNTSGNTWVIVGFDKRPDNVFSSTVSTNTVDVDVLVHCVESFWGTGSNGV